MRISHGSVAAALRVLNIGSKELIDHVDAGRLPVSVAAHLVFETVEKVEQVVQQRIERRERPRSKAFRRDVFPVAQTPHLSLASFGVLGKDPDKNIMLFWVDAGGLDIAIRTLRRKLRYIPGEAKPGSARLIPHRG